MVSRIQSLPLVTDVIPNYRGSVTVQSSSESKTDTILSMDPEKLQLIAPTLEYAEGSTMQPSNPQLDDCGYKTLQTLQGIQIHF